MKDVSLAHALVIRHVVFEDLGCFEGPLARAGYDIHYHDITTTPLRLKDDLPDLLIVLGGPLGAYEEASYPFIRDELALLGLQMAANRPTLGICLGAQLMARALCARVYPGPEKEIGWKSVSLTAEGRESPLRHLADIPVLHWHGDTFDLPAGCALLASTPICWHQAFSKGPRILGLQFHPEVMGSRFEPWLVGHACEIAQQYIPPELLRAQTAAYAPRLEGRAVSMIEDWLAGLNG